MTDEEMLFHIKQNTRLNRVRKIFTEQRIKIAQLESHRESLRTEFETIQKIARELGVKL